MNDKNISDINGHEINTNINNLNEDSSLNNSEIDQRTSHLEPSAVEILIRDNEEILNLEDDAINFLNEYADVGYVEEISGDEYESFDDNNMIGVDDNASIQVLMSDLEYEYRDLMTDVTFPGYKEKNLLVAHEEIIAILNEMKKNDLKEINESSALLKESQANSNESNSNTKTELFKSSNTSVLENSLKIDSILYCLILIMETHEDEYYFISTSKTRKPIYQNQLVSKDWYEELRKSNLSEVNCRSFSSDFIFNFKKIKKSTFKYSSICKLRNPVFERVVFLQTFNEDIFLCSERYLFTIGDFLDFIFEKENLYLFPESFYSDKEVLCLIEEKFQKKFPNFVYFDQARQLSFGIISGLIYLHKRNIIHNNLSLKTVFIDRNGRVKIGGLFYNQNEYVINTESDQTREISEEFGQENLSFSFDYHLLGEIISSIFIPGLEIFNPKNGPKIIYNNFLKSESDSFFQVEKNWKLFVLYNESFNNFLYKRFLKVGNEELGKFLFSFCLPYYKICTGYRETIIFRQFKKEFKENILSSDIINKLDFFEDLDCGTLKENNFIDKNLSDFIWENYKNVTIIVQ